MNELHLINLGRWGRQAVRFCCALIFLAAFIVSTAVPNCSAVSSKDTKRLIVEGSHLVEAGRQAQAIQIFSEALAAEPSCADALMWRARAHQELHQLSQAASDAEAAFKLQPQNIWVVFRVASIRGALGDSESAITLLSRLIAFQPSNQEFLLERADQLLRIGKYKAALVDAQNAQELSPKESLAYFREACCHRGLKELDKARKELEIAIKIAPRDYYLRELGDLYIELRKYDDAAAIYNRGRQMQPQDGSWPAKLAYVAKLENMPLKTILALYNQSIALSPADSLIYTQRAEVLFELNLRQEALVDVNKAISINPDEPISYFRRACFYRSMGRYEQALTDLNLAIAQQPRSYFYGARAEVYMRLGQYQQAIVDADEALKLEPHDKGSLKLRSTLYARTGDYEQALHDMDSAQPVLNHDTAQKKTYSPTSVPDRLFNQVASSYGDLLRLFPDDTTALYNRGFAYLCLGKSAAGASDLKKFVDKSVSQRSRVLAAAFANIGFREAGDNVNAKLVLDKVIPAKDFEFVNSFPETLISYLRGKVDASAIFKSASSRDSISQSQCLVGMDLLLKKQSAQAKSYLIKVVENGDYRLDEFSLAQARLAKLKK